MLEKTKRKWVVLERGGRSQINHINRFQLSEVGAVQSNFVLPILISRCFKVYLHPVELAIGLSEGVVRQGFQSNQCVLLYTKVDTDDDGDTFSQAVSNCYNFRATKTCMTDLSGWESHEVIPLSLYPLHDGSGVLQLIAS